MIHQQKFTIETSEKIQIINITDQVGQIIKKSGIRSGLVLVSVPHTSMGLVIQEHEPLLLSDFKDYIGKFAYDDEENPKFQHNCTWLRENCGANEPRNASAHLRSLFTGINQTIPISEGKMVLGKWGQCNYL